MDKIAQETKELIMILANQKEESPEKNIKELGSSSNDETIDAESSEKSILSYLTFSIRPEL